MEIPADKRYVHFAIPYPASLGRLTFFLRCPRGRTACMLPGAKKFNGENYECVDTRSDLESCMFRRSFPHLLTTQSIEQFENEKVECD